MNENHSNWVLSFSQEYSKVQLARPPSGQTKTGLNWGTLLL